MKNIFENKNCLITGATGGMGKEIVKNLAQKGSNLFLTSKNEKKLQSLSEELEAQYPGIKIQYDECDLSNPEQLPHLIKKIRNKFSSIDILVNCAGIFLLKSLKESTVQDFKNCFRVNNLAPFILSKEFSNDMIEKKWGRIVNIGSSSSYNGFKNGTIYCASKHSLLGFSRALHDELKENNVRVSCISPASTKTEMAKLSTDQDYETFLDPKDVAEFVIFSISFDKEMTIGESRLNRMVPK